MSKIQPNIDKGLYTLQDTGTYSSGSSQTKELSEEQLKQEFDAFENIDLKNKIHKEELLRMFPLWLIEQASKSDLELLCKISRYDKQKQTFVVGIFERKGLESILVSYKRRRLGDIKWHTRKDTHPNHLPLIRLKNTETMVYGIEGHHDMLTAILLGIDFIMLPTAGFKLSQYPQLAQSIKNRDILFLVEDERAHKCMSSLSIELREHAQSIHLKALGDGETKMDLSDYGETCKSIKEVIDGLQDY